MPTDRKVQKIKRLTSTFYFKVQNILATKSPEVLIENKYASTTVYCCPDVKSTNIL